MGTDVHRRRPLPRSPKDTPAVRAAQPHLVANADDEAPDLATATFTLVPVPKDSEEFWDLEEKFGSGLQGVPPALPSIWRERNRQLGFPL